MQKREKKTYTHKHQYNPCRCFDHDENDLIEFLFDRLQFKNKQTKNTHNHITSPMLPFCICPLIHLNSERKWCIHIKIWKALPKKKTNTNKEMKLLLCYPIEIHNAISNLRRNNKILTGRSFLLLLLRVSLFLIHSNLTNITYTFPLSLDKNHRSVEFYLNGKNRWHKFNFVQKLKKRLISF